MIIGCERVLMTGSFARKRRRGNKNSLWIKRKKNKGWVDRTIERTSVEREKMIKMDKESGTREKAHIYCELKLTKTPESRGPRASPITVCYAWHHFYPLPYTSLLRPRSWAVSTLVTYLASTTLGPLHDCR